MLPRIQPRSAEERQAAQQRKLIGEEAKIGGELFGPIPKGHRREFFCLDQYTWVWHEEWFDQKGKHQSITTRYEMRPQGVLKAQDGQPYQRLGRDEAKNLLQATQLYAQRVAAYYQQMLKTA